MVIYYSNRLKGDGFNKQFIYSDLGDRRCFYMGRKKFTYARLETKTLKLSSCGKTINYWFSYFLLYIAVNLSCWLDKNNTFIYFLPKTLNNCNYCIAIKTKFYNKFIVFCHFLSPKQHQTINLSFCIVFKFHNNTKQWIHHFVLLFFRQ